MLQYADLSKIVNSVIFSGYTFEADGSITAQDGTGWKIAAGKESNYIKDVLNKAGIHTEISESINEIKAEKMIFNCATALSSAVENKTLGELIETESKEKILALAFETYEVLLRKYPLRPFDQIKKEMLTLLQKISNHRTSVSKDFNEGKLTEVKYLNGQIINWAKEFGVPVPVNEMLYKRFNEMSSKKTTELQQRLR